MPPVVEIYGLTKFFGDTVGVSELDFTVEDGEIFGFLGPNAAGKTTAIRLMMNFIRQDRGSIRIFDRDISWGDYRYRRHIGYLPGEINFPPSVPGGVLLDYWGELGTAGAYERSRWLKTLDFAPSELRRPTRQYSRGIRQKLGLIGALQSHPRLAILDEPTEGLDPLIKHFFLEELSELGREGCTIFFSSHNLTEVEHLADTVGIIRRGRLVSKESIDEMKRRNLQKRVEIHFKSRNALEDFIEIYPCQAEKNGLQLTFIANDKPGRLISALQGFDIADFTVTQPGLEEIFLEYYQDVD